MLQAHPRGHRGIESFVGFFDSDRRPLVFFLPISEGDFVVADFEHITVINALAINFRAQKLNSVSALLVDHPELSIMLHDNRMATGHI